MHTITSKDAALNFESSLDSVAENYWRILDVNLAWIRQSDTKAYTIFMIYGISISLVFSNVDMIKSLIINSKLVMLLAVIYLGASLVAIIFGFRCIQPSLKLKFPPSVIFFGSIARTYTTPEDYHQQSKKVLGDPDKMNQELCNQIFINSIIARGKFEDITKSISAFLVSLITLLLIVLNYFI